ncbi:unnamed protein product [Caenorhabditis brenneri]
MRFVHCSIFLSTFLSIIYCDTTCVVHKRAENSGSRKFDCNIDNCWVKIESDPKRAIQLDIKANEYHVKVHTYYKIKDDAEVSVSKGLYDNNKKYYSGPNEGFYLIRASGRCSGWYPAEYSFKRVAADETLCDPIVNYVGNEIKVVQRQKHKYSGDVCPYHLLPSNKSSSASETVYLLSLHDETLQATVNGVDSNQETGKVITSKSWSSLDMNNNYLNYRYDTLPEIIAVSNKQTCQCNETSKFSHTSGNYSEFTLHSPGYPDFLCPLISCDSLISFPKLSVTDGFVERKLVSLHAQSRSGISLQLKSNLVNVELNENSFPTLSTSFIVDESDLEVAYKTPKNLYLGSDGHFKMVIKQIQIRNDCVCSIFNRKLISKNYSKRILIPYQCDTFFCDWTITPSPSAKSRGMYILMENVHSDDEVQVWNKQMVETYNSQQLSTPRRLFITETTHNTHLFFWRKSKGFNSTFSVLWKDIDSAECNGEQHYSLGTTPWAITSGNYPMPYNSGECKIILEAPENYFITLQMTDFDVENFHDELYIYNGNSNNSALIRHLTGEHKDLMFTSTGSSMLVNFVSDDQHSKRGFHFVATAVPNMELLSKTTEVPELISQDNDKNVSTTTGLLFTSNSSEPNNDTISESTPSNFHPDTLNISSTESYNAEQESEYGILHLLFAILIVIGVVTTVLAVFWVVNKEATKSRIPNPFVNAMVRYHNSDSESTTTIET